MAGEFAGFVLATGLGAGVCCASNPPPTAAIATTIAALVIRRFVRIASNTPSRKKDTQLH
jgi:hypothetical protein